MTEDAAAPRSGIHRILYGPYGLRAGWRILAFVLLAGGVGMVLASIAAALGLGGEMNVTFAVLLLGALVAGCAMLAFVDRRRPGALGFALEPAAVRDSAAGLGVGAAMLGGSVAVLAVASMARWVADEGTVSEYVAALASSFAFFAIAAAAEEAMFRGYAFQALGAWFAARPQRADAPGSGTPARAIADRGTPGWGTAPADSPTIWNGLAERSGFTNAVLSRGRTGRRRPSRCPMPAGPICCWTSRTIRGNIAELAPPTCGVISTPGVVHRG